MLQEDVDSEHLFGKYARVKATPLEGVRPTNDTVYNVVEFTEGGARDESERQRARRPTLDREILE